MTLLMRFKMNFFKQLKQLKQLNQFKPSLKTDILPVEILYSVMGEKSIDAKKSFLKRACQKGDLIRVKNGLYLLGEDYRKYTYNPYEVANTIQRPSYVSLESALSHYGLIPEAVYTTTSVTTNKNIDFDTPIGHYSFNYLKTKYFNFGFYQAKDGVYQYLIATPLKALMDTIVLKKKIYQTVTELQDDLRFDMDEFKSYKEFVNKMKIDEMLNIYKSHRLQVILKDLRKKL